MTPKEKEDLDWCWSHKGSLWAITMIEHGVESVHGIGLFAQVDKGKFCLISDDGNRYDEPCDADKIRDYLTHGRTLTKNLKYKFKCIQNKISYDKLLTPAYKVLFTKQGDNNA